MGWNPFPIAGKFAGRTRTASIETMADLRERIEFLNDYAKSIDRREALDVNMVPFGSRMNSQDPLDYGAFRDQVAELESIGVTWLSLGVPGRSRDEYLESIERFGAEVIG